MATAVLLGGLVAGCAPDHPLERLDDDRAASAEAVVAAEEFASMLGELETEIAVRPSPGAAPGDARSTVEELSGGRMELGNQSRAFFEGHASQVERDTRAAGLTAAEVAVVAVTEADDDEGPVSLVTVDTVRTPADGPTTRVRASYALSWDEGPAAGTGSTPGRLEQVRAVHDDDGHHALVDPSSRTSTLGVAQDYVTALRSGSPQDVDALEGGVRSSADLREAMRGRLAASGRMTPVEVPCGRTGATEVVYVVLDGDVPPLRLEIDVSGESPVVNAYL